MAKKIPVSESATPLTGSPFGGLEMNDLPPGPENSPAPAASKPRKNGRVVLRREKSQRGGKTVVVVDGFAAHFSASELEDLARRARQSCGCGGTVRERTIELQGNAPARVRRFFEAEGFLVGGV